jgi:hypothetical protein
MGNAGGMSKRVFTVLAVRLFRGAHFICDGSYPRTPRTSRNRLNTLRTPMITTLRNNLFDSK